MNNELQEFARSYLKDGLAKLTEKNRELFKRMYSHQDLTKNISQVVDEMPEGLLETAMRQVKRTLIK